MDSGPLVARQTPPTRLATSVNRRDRRFDRVQGRFHFHPEWAGYMGKSYKTPTFRVTAVTVRRPETKPIFFALGVHMLDRHNTTWTTSCGVSPPA